MRLGRKKSDDSAKTIDIGPPPGSPGAGSATATSTGVSAVSSAAPGASARLSAGTPAPDSSPVIEITDLTKRFGKVTALDQLSMRVERGQVHGFLGPNGAGKSTTLRVLLGLLRPTSGSARLLGGDPFKEAPALHRRLAYVPGDVSLWPNLTGGEAIDLLMRARGVNDRQARNSLIRRFDLDPTRNGRTYSKGNRQKVALVAALAGPAELLILDEPTSGLDPLMERVFREVVQERANEGTTVLLSSHILSEVEALCDRVSIIKDGRIVESGTLEDLRHLHRTEVVATLHSAPPTRLATLDGVHNISIDGDRWSAQVDHVALSTVMSTLADAGLKNLVSRPPSLEELFIEHYQATPASPKAPQASPQRDLDDSGPQAPETEGREPS